MAAPVPPEERRVAMGKWLTENGIDPSTVPLHSSFSISETGDGRVIHYSEYVLTDDGHKQLAPGSEEAWEKPATRPCTVEPPAWLNVKEGRS